MFEPCPVCGGDGIVLATLESASEREYLEGLAPYPDPCPSCVGGRVVSESVIEAIARALYEHDTNGWHKWEEIADEPSDVVIYEGRAKAAVQAFLEYVEVQ